MLFESIEDITGLSYIEVSVIEVRDFINSRYSHSFFLSAQRQVLPARAGFGG